MSDLTVLESAVQHHSEGCAVPVAAHVDMLVAAAMSHGRKVYEVVFDADGRASLSWVSCPIEVWESLLQAATRTAVIESFLIALLGKQS